MKKRRGSRSSSLSRRTKETSISVSIKLDGSGSGKVALPDEFLRHMVETLAKYAGFDLVLEAEGDIDHHLTEDVAITLGRALREAMGEEPIARIAYAVVPMDEALVMASVDLIDRPFVDVEVPWLMYEHFLRSLAMELRATVHTKVLRGQDEHHIIEATFKALGLSLGRALAPADRLISTKSRVEWKREG